MKNSRGGSAPSISARGRLHLQYLYLLNGCVRYEFNDNNIILYEKRY